MNTTWRVEGNDQLQEFLNQNMHRNYPIQDECVVQAEDGTYLPSSFLVDCLITIPCTDTQQRGIDASRFFVSSVDHYTNSVQVVISYQPESGSAFQCAVSTAIVLASTESQSFMATAKLTPASGIPENAVYEPLKRLDGTLWIGTTAGLANLGTQRFTYEHAQLKSTCIVKNLEITDIISTLTVLDSAGVPLATLSGNITLQTDGSVVLEFDPVTNTITIGVNDTWLNGKLNMLFNGAGTPIKKINGQAPDGNGNFTLSGLDCTDIKTFTGTNGIGITNTCSKPCCGEDSGDLVDIKDSQKSLQDKVDRISENLNSFINSINNVETRLPSLVASRK